MAKKKKFLKVYTVPAVSLIKSGSYIQHATLNLNLQGSSGRLEMTAVCRLPSLHCI